jgi:hypothetical protein
MCNRSRNVMCDIEVNMCGTRKSTYERLARLLPFLAGKKFEQLEERIYWVFSKDKLYCCRIMNEFCWTQHLETRIFASYVIVLSNKNVYNLCTWWILRIGAVQTTRQQSAAIAAGHEGDQWSASSANEGATCEHLFLNGCCRPFQQT